MLFIFLSLSHTHYIYIFYVIYYIYLNVYTKILTYLYKYASIHRGTYMFAKRYTIVHTQLLLFKEVKRQKYKKSSSDSVPFKTWQDQQKLALEELKSNIPQKK